MNGINKRTFALSITLSLAMLALTACGGGIKVPDEYSYDDWSQYIRLGDYKGIEYEAQELQVTDAEVQETIDELLSESSETKQVKDGKVEGDSVINIDYVGSIDGVEFDGGSASGVDLDMADNNYIAGFSDSIIGHNAGETFDIHVTFPADYGSEDLAGKPAVFRITVNYIEEETTPEYSNDWVKKNTDYKNIDDFEKGIKQEMLDNKSKSAEADQKNEVFNKIVDSSEVIKYPEKEYEDRFNTLVNSYKNYAESNDMAFKDYLYDEMGMTEKEFNAMAKETAENAVKNELVLHAIASAEGIKISDSDYDDYLNQLLEDSGYDEESYKDAMGITIQQYAEANNLYTSLLYQKVMDKVMEYSVPAES